MPNPTCSVPACDRIASNRQHGLCAGHRYRKQRNGDAGDTPIAPRTFPPVDARFWPKVAVGAPGECWEWQGALDHHGHGRFWGDTGRIGAHRYAFELAAGRPIRDGLVIDHLCHNRACVNVRHLREVTQEKNAQNLGVAPSSSTGIRNVYTDRNKYRVLVEHRGKQFRGGTFANLADAEAAAIALRIAVHGPIPTATDVLDFTEASA